MRVAKIIAVAATLALTLLFLLSCRDGPDLRIVDAAPTALTAVGCDVPDAAPTD